MKNASLELCDSLAPKCMPMVMRRDYVLHYDGFIDFPSLLWFITINLNDFVSSLIFNPLLLTRSFSLTRMLFKSQQISFMLTLRSKVIHPRLKNLPKRDRNQLNLKKIYILKFKKDIDPCGSLTFYLDWDLKEPLEDNPQISYKPGEVKEST